jgi:glycosyltransferase involved in cell wall biosynthesis
MILHLKDGLKKMKSKYSVIMPTKNSAKTVLESIESVFNQTYLTAELIIVDESSTDNTIELIRENFPTVRIIQNLYEGAQGALNISIPQVKTEFISFLDSDDLWADEKSQCQIDYLIARSDIEVVSSGVSNFLEHFGSNENAKYTKDFGPTRLFTASTFRTETFRRVGLPSTSADYFVWQIDWWIRASAIGIKTGLIDKVHLHRRIHKSNSWMLNKEKGIQSIFDITRKHIKNKEINQRYV